MLTEDTHHQWSDGFIEFEDDVADEAIADDDVERPTVAGAGGKISTLNVAVKIEPGFLEEHMRLLHDGVSLLRLLSDRKESDRRVGATEDALSVNCAKPGKLEQLLAGAVDVGTRINDDHRICGGRENRGDCRTCETRLQLEQHRRRCHLCPGIPRRNERVGPAFRLQAEADYHRAVRLPAQASGRLF